MSLISAGPSPDAIVNAGTALLTAFVAACVSLVISVLQSRAHKKDQESAAAQWQEQAEELRDRMAAQYESQIAYLKTELRRAQRRRGGEADDV